MFELEDLKEITDSSTTVVASIQHLIVLKDFY